MNFALVLLYEYQYSPRRKSGVCPSFKWKYSVGMDWFFWYTFVTLQSNFSDQHIFVTSWYFGHIINLNATQVIIVDDLNA